MGRPYAAELRELDATYSWCLRAPLDGLAASIGRLVNFGTLNVGSGGSLTAAHFATLLHSRFTGKSAQTLTPYELASTGRFLDQTAILVCSAGGSNPDILAAASTAAKRFPAELIAVTTRQGSALEQQLDETGWARCHAFSTPTKKDGFLATNSLLATVVLLARAYESYAGALSSLPPTLDELLHPGMTRHEFVALLRSALTSIIERQHIVLLHGAITKPAAMDFESRFTEAAIAAIQPADYRNFAHGRHHWLARHPDTTGVISLSDDSDAAATRTLSLIPPTIPRWQLSVPHSVGGAISAICHSILVAHLAGEVHQIDPGRPHVPAFGRKLYHLRAMPSLFPGMDAANERLHLAIERKSRLPVATLASRQSLDTWQHHFRAFLDRLEASRLQAIVLDYDGTICGASRRLLGPSPEIVERLNALLDAGLTVAVATGRGKSVRSALRQVFVTEASRSNLIVGYHNGAEISSLMDDACPPIDLPLVADLQQLAAALRDSRVLASHGVIEAKGQQISIETRSLGDPAIVFAEASRLVHADKCKSKVTVLSSSHSVDIVACGVNKLNVVRHLASNLGLTDGGATSILCIGDRGRFPGNDADLLIHPLSLSVDEVSGDESTCWNIAEPGRRFDLACLEYLSRLRPTKQGFRFDIKGVRP